LSGKWHLGDSLHAQKGMSRWYTFKGGATNYYGALTIRDGETSVEERYLTDTITDYAVEFIEEQARAGAPFALSVNYNAPHAPWIDQHPKEYTELYADCPFRTCPQEPYEQSWLDYHYLGTIVPTNLRACLEAYYGSITALDAGVGRLLDTLERLGLREDTLVCFMSDNGYNLGHHGFWGKGNGTFPINMFDTSVKVPAIFSRPGTIAQGAVSDALLSGYDFMPTLLEHLGLAEEPPSGLPGGSFDTILRGGAGRVGGAAAGAAGHDEICVFDEYGPVRMIRTREWKYVERHPDGPNELYDLVYDPGERANLINDPLRRALVADLRRRLGDWFARYANPSLDGTKLPVSGKGQRGRAAVPVGSGAAGAGCARAGSAASRPASSAFNPVDFRQKQRG
jgi:arylsulfatase A-like enzyme